MQSPPAFAGSYAAEQVIDADVFIEVGPVNTLATCDEPPIVELRFGSAGKARIPLDRNLDGAPVCEIHL